MNTLVAIPIYRLTCRVTIDKGRPWSVADEILLWAVSKRARSIADLATASSLPRQLVVASLARLMRFRLIEVRVTDDAVEFQSSEIGLRWIQSGDPLPFFPKQYPRWVSFVVERATGEFFAARDVRRLRPPKLEIERANGTDVRMIEVTGDEPPISHVENFARLSALVARGWDEQIANIDARTATMRDDEFMVVRVSDGIPFGIPEEARPTLREIISQACSLDAKQSTLSVSYTGPAATSVQSSPFIATSFVFDDILVGGPSHRECVLDLLEQASHRVIIHSTFLSAGVFEGFFEAIRNACRRGVTIDVLWGAERDEQTEVKYSTVAAEIMSRVREDPDTHGRVRVHLRSTGSHAKLLLADTDDDAWIAVVGSCNWLSSPFKSVELSVVLRDPMVVAEVATAFQRLVGRRGLVDSIATELAVISRDLRLRATTIAGTSHVRVVTGEIHDATMRDASTAAQRRLLVGSNKLGSTARPGTLIPGETAALRNASVVVLYTAASGPLKDRPARDLVREAAGNGIRLVATEKTRLHGKVLAWDDDDVVITSLNWASASSNPEFPWSEIGVHVRSPGIARDLISKLESLFPMLVDSVADAHPRENEERSQ